MNRYYISLWYKRRELAQRVGFTSVVTTVGGATVGLIAYGISQMPTDKLNTWQWYGTFSKINAYTEHDVNVDRMCIIFGSPSILLSIFALFQISDKPETAKFFNEKERNIEIERLRIGKPLVALVIHHL